MNTKYKILLLIISFFFSNLLFAAENPIFSVELKVAKQKNGTSNSNITISIKNNSTKDLKLLKWNTPLESVLSANIFDVKQNDKKTNYIGRLVKRGKPTDTDFVLIKAGEVITTNLEIAKYYKMDKKAKYRIAYKGSFLYDENILTKRSLTRKLKHEKISKKSVEFDYTPLKKEPTVEEINTKEVPTFTSCSTEQENEIILAHNEAINISKIASTDMNNAATPTSDDRYSEWFGSVNTNRHNIIKNNFSAIFSTLDTKNISFNCACEQGSSSTYAYVYPNKPYEINLCGAFWNAPLEGTDSQSGTLVHETSHFTIVAGTDDYVYGQYNARELAIKAPYSAVYNADSLEFFAENSPSLEMTDYMSGQPIYENIISYVSLLQGYTHEATIYDIDINGNYTTQNTDEFTFSVPTSGTLLVYTTNNLDTIGRLYNNNSLISYNDDTEGDATNGSNFEISQKINAGQHYITVDSYSSHSGDYTLHVKFTPSPNITPAIMYLLN